jgi:phage gpG-like protein
MAPTRLRLPSGLGLDSGLVHMDFIPSVGIVAASYFAFAGKAKMYREPLTRAVKDVMIPSIQKNFDSEGRPAWASLDADTIFRKSEEFADMRILHRTRGAGALSYAATRQARWKITSTWAAFTNLPPSKWYGIVHQTGGSRSATTSGGSLEERIARGIAEGPGASFHDWILPARPFVMFQTEDGPAIEAVFDVWLHEMAAETGWRPGV